MHTPEFINKHIICNYNTAKYTSQGFQKVHIFYFWMFLNFFMNSQKQHTTLHLQKRLKPKSTRVLTSRPTMASGLAAQLSAQRAGNRGGDFFGDSLPPVRSLAKWTPPMWLPHRAASIEVLCVTQGKSDNARRQPWWWRWPGGGATSDGEHDRARQGQLCTPDDKAKLLGSL
jgi:hypothetical protein